MCENTNYHPFNVDVGEKKTLQFDLMWTKIWLFCEQKHNTENKMYVFKAEQEYRERTKIIVLSAL